jgi:hydroxyacylglutathione hydrolase
MPEVHTIVTGEWRENCYVLRGHGRHAVVVDPGEDTDAIIGYLSAESLTVDAIINTHAHYDHVGSVADIRARYNAPFHLHAGDHRLLKQVNFYRVLFGGKRAIAIPEVDVDLAACPTLMFAGMSIEVIHTPGHTSGSVSFLTEGLLFSGDTLFGSRVGRTDLPGGDRAALGASVQRLLQLPPETVVFPGHGARASLAEILSANREAAELLK